MSITIDVEMFVVRLSYYSSEVTVLNAEQNFTVINLGSLQYES